MAGLLAYLRCLSRNPISTSSPNVKTTVSGSWATRPARLRFAEPAVEQLLHDLGVGVVSLDPDLAVRQA
jgi:hypothetical protein